MVLLEELVVEVVLSKLAIAALAPPVGTGGAGSACLGLVAAVVVMGVVVIMGREVGLVLFAIAAAVWELCEPERLCYSDSACAEAGRGSRVELGSRGLSLSDTLTLLAKD